MRHWFLTFVLQVLVFGSSFSAYATPMFDPAGTTLLGFDALAVGADSYNVRFADGSYDVLTAGGTLSGFSSYIEADRASNALLTAFYGLGDLGAQSFKSFGCGGALSTCGYYTVASNLYLQNRQTPVVDVAYFSLENFTLYPAIDIVSPVTDLAADDLVLRSKLAYASWRLTQPNVAVPEPATMVLFGIGLLGLVRTRCRRNSHRPITG